MFIDLKFEDRKTEILLNQNFLHNKAKMKKTKHPWGISEYKQYTLIYCC